MAHVIRELRLAIRTLVRQPMFAVVSVLTLGIGVGSSTALFSVVRGVLLAPLAYQAPEQLVRVTLYRPRREDETMREREYLSVPLVWSLRAREDVFAGLAAMNTYAERGADLTTGGSPRRVRELPVTPDFFDVLGVHPSIGRGFTSEEAGEDVVAIAYGLWRAAFGADPAVLGRSIELDGVAHTIVGIAPRGFEPPLGFDADIWTPHAVSDVYPEAVGPNPVPPTDWGNHYLGVIGRLAPNVTLEAAQARLDAHAATLSAELRGPTFFRLTLLRQATVERAEVTLWVLMAAATLLLVSACLNVASLFLARGLERSRELAVRWALGSGRRRLLTHLLAEGVVLAVAGGVLGVTIAAGSIRVLTALRPEGLPRIGEIAIDVWALGFGLAVAVGAGLLFGLMPGVQFMRGALGHGVAFGSARSSHTRRHARWQGLLVAAQVAAAVVLLIGAGLLLKSLVNLQRVDLGFESEEALTFNVNLPTARYPTPESRIAFYDAWYRRLDAIPQIRSAGAVDWFPLNGRYHPWGFTRLDRPEAGGAISDARVVAGAYFRAMGIALEQGRTFDERDTFDANKVAVVSRSAVEATYPGEDVLGKRIRLLGREWTIVGVVGDVPYEPYGTIVPHVYLPHAQFADNRNWRLDQVVVWRGDLQAGIARVRREVAALDPDLVVDHPRSLSSVVRAATARQRFTLFLMIVFATASIILAGVGLYGVLSYLVRQKQHEIGIRLGLGANSRDVVAIIVRRAMMMTIVGLAIGWVTAVALGRWLRALVFEVDVTDPWVYLAVAVGVLGIAWMAAYVPARRAASVDPLLVLREAR